MEKKIIQKSELKIASYTRTSKLPPGHWYMLDRMYITEGGFFCREILTLPSEKEVEYYKGRILAASISRFSTPISFWIYEGDKFLGWGEQWLSGADSTFKDGMSCGRFYAHCPLPIQKQIFLNHCLHQSDLAARGYVEMDLAPQNWFLTGGQIKTFDKDSVHSIERSRHCFKRIDNSIYFSMAKNAGLSPKILTEQLKQQISYNLTHTPESDLSRFWQDLYEKQARTNNDIFKGEHRYEGVCFLND